MRGLFITGTDTSCGKTSVGIAIVRACVAAGVRVRILKPVETGCVEQDGELVPADARLLAQAAGDERPLADLCPYRLPLPAAPDVAAAHEGIEIDPNRIYRAYREAKADADLVIVEGAGGLLVPIAPGLDMAGVARALETPLVVVARAALGTLNHTLLTLEATATRSLEVLGVVISHTQPELPPAERLNLDRLLERLPAPLLGELPHNALALNPPLDSRALLSTIDPY